MTPPRGHSQACPTCYGIGWVCEDHPDQPWQHEGCTAAGQRCLTGRVPAGMLRARQIGRAGTTRARGLGRP